MRMGQFQTRTAISSILPDDNFPFWIEYSPPNDFIRATFAYLMAAMTDAERDAIVEGL